ncbi:hypothetical protein QRX29_28095, partial [Escherichia coli]|nr:hypothetical protein [Escherichia coli]
VSISVILFNSRFRSYGAQGVLKKHPFCGAFLVFWGFKFLSIKMAFFLVVMRLSGRRGERSRLPKDGAGLHVLTLLVAQDEISPLLIS